MSTIARDQRALRFPTRFSLVAATNPCPVRRAAGAPAAARRRPRSLRARRLSGALLDRIDLLVAVERPTADELVAEPGDDLARTLSSGSRRRASASFSAPDASTPTSRRGALRDVAAELTRAPSAPCARSTSAARSARAAAIGCCASRGRSPTSDDCERIGRGHLLRAAAYRQDDPPAARRAAAVTGARACAR